MKAILILVFGIATCAQVRADCASAGLWTIPQNGTIKQNSLIVLAGADQSQEIVTSLNVKYPIYLYSGGHKVKLRVKGVFKSLFDGAQAILELDGVLIAGRTYELKIDSLTKLQSYLLNKWNSDLGMNVPISWLVEGGTDTKAPEFVRLPELVDKRTINYGCGPAVFTDFKMQTQDESEVLVKTEFVDMETSKSMIYLLSIYNGDTLSVGHGMCGGAFVYEKDKQYKVRFSLMDICGNEDGLWTDWIEFDSPLDED